MACSRFEYVKQFENQTALLKNTYIVIRIDGHCFHKFTKEHGYSKPNDKRGLALMNRAAKYIMTEFSDIIVGFGQSDEFSFVFGPQSTFYGRRESKLITNIVSLFTAKFVLDWKLEFNQDLKYPPSFDARAVCYPTLRNIRDYMSWRQADCHINNLVIKINSVQLLLLESGSR